MANTLTGLIPTLYSALDVVSRELIGFIPNVSRDAQTSSAGIGQSIRSPVVPQAALENIVAGNDPADSGDQTIGYTDVTITKAKAYPVRWTGEEQLLVTPNGVVNTILRNQFAQGLRTLTNAMEADLAGLYLSVARAYGTSGTTPFGTANNHSDFAGANRILDELGAPQSMRAMVVGSAARANIEGIQSGLFKVNEAGTDDLLRRRQMRELHDFGIGYSAGIKTHEKGTATGVTVNGAVSAGATTITFDGATAGATGIKAGDVITFAADTFNKYVVATGATGASGTFTIAAPGLAVDIPDNNAVTILNSYTANMFFTEQSLLLAARAPAMPVGGDSADDVTVITDPVTGLSFQVAVYKQYRRVKYEIGAAWGVAAPNGKHAGLLLG